MSWIEPSRPLCLSPLAVFDRNQGGHNGSSHVIHEYKVVADPDHNNKKGRSGKRAFGVPVGDELIDVAWLPSETCRSLVVFSNQSFSRIIRRNGNWEIGFGDPLGNEIKTAQYDATDGALLLGDSNCERFPNAVIPLSLTADQLRLLSDTFSMLEMKKAIETIGMTKAQEQNPVSQSPREFSTSMYEVVSFHMDNFQPEIAIQPKLF